MIPRWPSESEPLQCRSTRERLGPVKNFSLDRPLIPSHVSGMPTKSNQNHFHRGPKRSRRPGPTRLADRWTSEVEQLQQIVRHGWTERISTVHTSTALTTLLHSEIRTISQRRKNLPVDLRRRLEMTGPVIHLSVSFKRDGSFSFAGQDGRVLAESVYR